MNRAGGWTRLLQLFAGSFTGRFTGTGGQRGRGREATGVQLYGGRGRQGTGYWCLGPHRTGWRGRCTSYKVLSALTLSQDLIWTGGRSPGGFSNQRSGISRRKSLGWAFLRTCGGMSAACSPHGDWRPETVRLVSFRKLSFNYLCHDTIAMRIDHLNLISFVF